MKLILAKSQINRGVISSKKGYAIKAKVELTDAERDIVRKFDLYEQVIYKSVHDGGDSFLGNIATIMKSTVLSVYALTEGKTIECEDIFQLIEIESALHSACQNLKDLIDATAGFEDEVVIEF